MKIVREVQEDGGQIAKITPSGFPSGGNGMISAHKHENGDIAITWLRGGMESTQKVQAMIDGLQAALKEAEAMKKGTFKESSAKESSAKASRPQTSAEKVARKILARDINDITKG